MMSVWKAFTAYVAGWSTGAIALRLVSALIIGVLIGIDRGIKRRGAGIKTHTLVCLGSALVMLTGQYIYVNFGGTMDIARLGAQVISGVGFLGVGTIIVTGRNQVRGLTTAAGLWACACLGLAAGIGFVDGALITLVLILVTLKFLSKVDDLIHKSSKVFDLYIEFDCNKSVGVFIEEMRRQNLKINNFELGKSKLKTDGPNAMASVEVEDRYKRPIILQIIREMPGIRFVEEL